MAVIKHSRQRDAILQSLMSRYDHPTAEAVYKSVREVYPNISLGTVYRNLSLLVDMGQAIKVPCEDGSVHFDGNVQPHYHLQCSCCKNIYDIEIPEESKMLEQLLLQSVDRGFDGVVSGSTAFFTGVCKECQESEA